MTSKKVAIIAIIIILLFIAISVIGNIFKSKKNESENNDFQILTSFYPLYVATLNITKGAQNVEINNMADNYSGCIHDYTLTTSDLKKFEKADVFIENGNGLEPFIDKIKTQYPDVTIIEAGAEVQNLLGDEEEINAHIWLSIENYKTEVRTIANKLAELDEENSSIYTTNADEYIAKLDEKSNIFSNLNYKDEYVVCLNESLEYFLNDLGMNIEMIETDHEQAALSAEQVKNIIEQGKEKGLKKIFIDINDDAKNAEMIAKETNATIIKLDSEMSGEPGNLDAYLNSMQFNYEALKQN